MGALNISSKRRRRFFDILKYEEEDEKLQSDSSDSCSDELLKDIGDYIDKEMMAQEAGKPDDPVVGSEFTCPVCDKEFKRKGDVKIHRKVHSGVRPHPCRNIGCAQAFKTSSNRLRHERICAGSQSKSKLVDQTQNVGPQETLNKSLSSKNDSDDIENNFSKIFCDENIFEEVLSEETDVQAEEQAIVSETLIDEYSDMLENLIASTSPDELLHKISITNEIPEDFENVSFLSCKRKLSEADLEEEVEGGVEQLKKGGGDEYVTNTKIKDTEQEYEIENTNVTKIVNFENLANKKIFRVLNSNLGSCNVFKYKSQNLSFSIKIPDLPNTRSDETEERKKTRKVERFSQSKCKVSNRFLIVRKDAEAFKSIQKKRAPYKRSKRGSLGWQFKLEMDQYEEIADGNVEDADDVCERLSWPMDDEDGDKDRFRFYKDHIGVKTKSYNKEVLENIYSNASSTKSFLKSNKQRNSSCENIIQIGESDLAKAPRTPSEASRTPSEAPRTQSEAPRTPVINSTQPKESRTTEIYPFVTSQQNSSPESQILSILSMPVLDCL
eukprot:GFUD01112868.1.p1 GENE.GFUD01112868.1~~GFUD01112868.1.p1  ORF type:complete len:572 (-),score=158.56 GFUD01112868.1:57-1715(-)